MKKRLMSAIIIAVMAMAVGCGDKAAQTASGNTVSADVTVSGPALSVEEVAAMDISGYLADVEVSENKIALKYNDNCYIVCNDFTNLDYVRENITVTDEELNEYIKENILSGMETVEPNDHTVVEDGDVVDIDYSGKIDDVAFEGGTAEGQKLTIGSGMFIPGFEEALIGMEIGETRDINVTFPEDYQATDLAGKDAVFTIVLNAIDGTSTVPDKLTDDMVETYYSGYGYTTAKEIEDLIYDYMLEERVRSFVIDYDICGYEEGAEIVDKELYDAFYKEVDEYYHSVGEKQEGGFDAVVASLSSQGIVYEELVDQYATESAKYVMFYQIMEQVFNISVTEEEMLQYVEDSGYTSVEEYSGATGVSKNSLKYYVVEQKFVDNFKNIDK